MTRPGLDIRVTVGTGSAPTELAAFDAALHVAGVAHFNLIRLSSLIPPGSHVTSPSQWQALEGRWGDRLYAVYAVHAVSTPGGPACAGLAWLQDENTGAGMFVEHAGSDEKSVEARLHSTLEDMTTRRPGRYGPGAHRIARIVCDDQPVAAVVIAAVRVEPW